MSTLVIPALVRSLADSLGDGTVFGAAEGGWFIPAWTVETGSYVPARCSSLQSNTPGSGGYYILLAGEVGGLHVLDCFEIYSFVGGDPATAMTIVADSESPVVTEVVLGRDSLHATSLLAVPGGVLQGLRGSDGGPAGYSLFSLATVPAFHPADARVPTRAELIEQYPDLESVIRKYTNEGQGSTMAKARPYMVHEPNSGVRIRALITVPESAPGGYRMGGVPDGIGAFATGDDTFDVVVTHELRFNHGGPHKHAASGAYVSRWSFDSSAWNDGEGELRLVFGKDLIESVEFWSRPRAEDTEDRGKYRNSDRVPLERLCSADLPAPSALWFEDGERGWGTKERLFLGGEETHTRYKPVSGRALAHVVTGRDAGKTWELPHLGRGSWENALASPVSQRKTIVMLPDDATAKTSSKWSLRNPPSELYVYIGEKQEWSADVEDFRLAGLFGGTLYGLTIDGGTAESNELGYDSDGGEFVGKARFGLVAMSDQSKDDLEYLPGIALQRESLSKGVFRFYRPEDGAWDPREDHPGEFWFVTTGEDAEDPDPARVSRLHHMVFDDILDPMQGGTIEIVASGRDEQGRILFEHLDSMCIDPLGRVFVQEDPGKASWVTRTLVWDRVGKTFRVVCEGDPVLFRDPSAQFITHNEEAAGMVPVFDLLGEGWFLSAIQCNGSDSWNNLQPGGLSDDAWARLKAHLYRPGQLMAMYVAPGAEETLPAIHSVEPA